MGFNTGLSTADTAEISKQIAAATGWLRQGRNAQAFALLSGPGMEKDPAAVFALGLCCLRADDPSSALSHFERALHLVKSLAPSPQAETGNAAYLKLYADQITEAVFLTPMDADFYGRFPKAAEQTVLLAMIHTCRLMGKDDQARRLAAGLAGPEFEAYKNKL